MNAKRTRSAAWAMINWAIVEERIKKLTTLLPDHDSIEKAISEIQDRQTDEQLFQIEAEELEDLLIRRIANILNQSHGKEIKRNRSRLERERKIRGKDITARKDNVQLMKIGNIEDLKKLGLDPAMMEKLSKNMMDQLFGNQKKKKSDDDDDDDEEPGASFYM